jgi:hypothetical protein
MRSGDDQVGMYIFHASNRVACDRPWLRNQPRQNSDSTTLSVIGPGPKLSIPGLGIPSKVGMNGHPSAAEKQDSRLDDGFNRIGRRVKERQFPAESTQKRKRFFKKPSRRLPQIGRKKSIPVPGQGKRAPGDQENGQRCAK